MERQEEEMIISDEQIQNEVKNSSNCDGTMKEGKVPDPEGNDAEEGKTVVFAEKTLEAGKSSPNVSTDKNNSPDNDNEMDVGEPVIETQEGKVVSETIAEKKPAAEQDGDNVPVSMQSSENSITVYPQVDSPEEGKDNCAVEKEVTGDSVQPVRSENDTVKTSSNLPVTSASGSVSVDSGISSSPSTNVNTQISPLPQNVPAVPQPTPKKSLLETIMRDNSETAKNYRPYARGLYDLGTNLFRERVLKDSLKLQNKKQAAQNLEKVDQDNLEEMTQKYKMLKSANKSFAFDQIRCPNLNCSFHAEFQTVIDEHQLYPYESKKGTYMCHFCDGESYSAEMFILHMENVHRKRGRHTEKRSFFLCPYCKYEVSNKATFLRHLQKCQMAFKVDSNLALSYEDSDLQLLVVKPVVMAKSAPAATGKVVIRPQAPRPQIRVGNSATPPTRPTVAVPIPAIKARPNLGGRPVVMAGKPVPPQNPVNFLRHFSSGSLNAISQDPKNLNIVQHALERAAHLQKNPKNLNIVQHALERAAHLQKNLRPTTPKGAQLPAGGGIFRAPATNTVDGNMITLHGQTYRLQTVNNNQFLIPVAQQPDVVRAPSNVLGTIKPAGKSPVTLGVVQPVTKSVVAGPQKTKAATKESVEECEICLGVVRDKQSLLQHLYHAHKVAFTKLSDFQKNVRCVLCNDKFYTLDGVKNHMVFKHKRKGGKSTPSTSTVSPGMNANVSPGMRQMFINCVVCGKTITGKNLEQSFWSHMVIHNVNPETIFGARKCLVCGIILELSPLATHLMNVHSHFFESVHTNKNKQVPVREFRPVCHMCSIEFRSEQDFDVHCLKFHKLQCSRCSLKFSDLELKKQHFHDAHGKEEDICPLCDRKVRIGRPFVRHMTLEHVKDCSVVVQLLPPSQAGQLLRNYVQWNETKKALEQNGPVVLPQQQVKAPQPLNGTSNTSDVIVIDDDTPRKRKSDQPVRNVAKRTKIHIDVVPSSSRLEEGKDKAVLAKATDVNGQEITIEVRNVDDAESCENGNEGLNYEVMITESPKNDSQDGIMSPQGKHTSIKVPNGHDDSISDSNTSIN